MNFFKNMKVRIKLSISFIIVAILIGIVGTLRKNLIEKIFKSEIADIVIN